MKINWRRYGTIALLVLIATTLALDFIHGIAMGQSRILFNPIFRLRQSLAVAISRQHDPAPGGYLAYKSVTDVLNKNGFAIFDQEPGPRPDVAEWAKLLNDGPRLNRIFQEARDVPIDTNLPTEVIGANELGLSDFIYWSFQLFGNTVSSLYYFVFLLVAVSAALYFLQFRNNPFLLLLLVAFLAGLYFLEQYAVTKGIELNTISNTRLFTAPALLPALHILLLLWLRAPLRPSIFAGLAVQSMILAFFLSCRTDVGWQVAMIAIIAIVPALFLLLRCRRCLLWNRRLQRTVLVHLLTPFWPAIAFMTIILSYSAVTSLIADKQYAMEPKRHLIWHEMLMGVLSSNTILHREYVGDEGANLRKYSDDEVYRAVYNDLNARRDATSPIAHAGPDGSITYDLMSGWGAYDDLARSLLFRIVLRHPLEVLRGFPIKARDQIDFFQAMGGLAWKNLELPMLLLALGAVACFLAGGFEAEFSMVRTVARRIGLVLVFAIVPTMIEPSALSVGTLFCYLGALAVAMAYAVAAASKLLRRCLINLTEFRFVFGLLHRNGFATDIRKKRGLEHLPI